MNKKPQDQGTGTAGGLDVDISEAIARLKNNIKPMDPFDFIESGALWIRTKTGPLIRFTPETMKPGQLRAYEYIRDAYRQGEGIVKVIWLKYRQGGFSTLSQAIMFALAYCRDNYNILTLSNVHQTADWLHRMDKLFFAEIERRGEAIHELERENQLEIIFKGNHSSIRIGSAGSKAIGITETRNACHATEVAYYDNWVELYGNLAPSIKDAPGNVIILESTANGVGDPFHQTWQASERGESGFVPFFFPWYEDPDYTAEPPADFTMTEDEATLAAEHGLDAGQVYWRRKTLAGAPYHGDVGFFSEKYPHSAMAAFRASGDIVFSGIRKTLTGWVEREVEAERGSVDAAESDGSRPPGFWVREKGEVEIYQQPKQGEKYCMYSDVGEGLRDIDNQPVMIDGRRITTTFSTCVVRKQSDWSLCAIMECRFPTDVFAEEALKLAGYYNNAFWGIEVPGPGEAVIARVKDRYRSNMYIRTWLDAQNQYRQQRDYGYRCDLKTKPTLESDWEAFVRGYPELLGSQRIALQALQYIRDGKTGKHRPRSGCFSDILMADMGCIQMLQVKNPSRQKVYDQAGRYIHGVKLPPGAGREPGPGPGDRAKKMPGGTLYYTPGTGDSTFVCNPKTKKKPYKSHFR